MLSLCHGAIALVSLTSAVIAQPASEFARTPVVADKRAEVKLEAATSASFARACVAADHPLASSAGAEILAKGGNAVDAAVAAGFALSVVRPFSCGIGGGGFMVIALPEKHQHDGRPARIAAINFRETCPNAVGPDYFEKLDPPDPLASQRGGKAVATPGSVQGLLYALEHFGTLDRATVLAPAIRLAREGFKADAFHVQASASLAPLFEQHSEWKTTRVFVWETLMHRAEIKIGDVVTLSDQAKALELIAQQGARAVSEGALAEAIAKSAQRAGGTLSLNDLRALKVEEIAPIRFACAGRTIVTMPPPSSGGVALAQILGIMERRDVVRLVKEQRWGEYHHALVEAFKHAFADRAEWMGDPAFVQVPVERLLSKAYLDERAAKIHVGRTGGPEDYGSREQLPEDGGTSHLSAVDSRGGAVACTQTINLIGGSLVEVAGFGFLLNDEMDDLTTIRGKANAFGLKQSDKNLPAPGKRPLSSMTPTIVLDASGAVECVIGASGGPRIISSAAQTLASVLFRGMSAREALAHPRMHHQWLPNVLELEDGSPDTWNGLGVDMWMRKFHHQVVAPRDGAAVQLIHRRRAEAGSDAPLWEAACDPRKGGAPAGQ